MKDRFDLESDLMSCWNVVDDINLLLETVMDSPRYSDIPPETCDMLSNSLIGIKELYDMRFQKVWNTFLESHKLDEYRDQ